MSTETVLTDAQCLAIGAFGQSPLKRLAHARAVERATLQSEQVQAWKKDAERYRWLREQCEKPLGGLTICEVGLFDLKPWSGDDPDHFIDAAMEKQP